MSIFAYVGLPGSGKSYGVVQNQVLPSLRDGRLVVTNLPLKVELLREVIPDCQIKRFETSELAENPELTDELFPPGCVAIIDECWRLWPAGLKVDRIPEAYKSFLAEHRHRVDAKGRSTQIVLVTQDLAQVAAFSRQLVEQTFVHRKLGSLGMRGKYTVSVYEGNVTGLTPPESKRITQTIGKYKPEVWNYYQSHTMSQSTSDGADETPVDSRGNIWHRPAIWLGLVASIAGLAFGGQWAYSAVSAPEQVVGAGGAVGAARPTTAKSGFVPSGPLKPQAEPAVWRVTGYIREEGTGRRGVAFVTDGTVEDFVPLELCTVQQYQVVCDYNGSRLGLRGPVSPRGEPIGSYSSADR